MRLKPLPLSLLLLAALAAPAQEDEGRVYFSLNTDRPVRPGETAPVRVSANGVDRLQFRLYRVNDPREFFRKLDAPHSFGAAVRPAARALTPIEKFAHWKRGWRNRVRNLVRTQFSAANRSHIRSEWLAPKPAPPSSPGAAQEYAGVSLLNPQQVVRVWEQPVQTAQRWDTVTVPVEIKDSGLYLVEATDGKKQAYTVISATRLALITKTAQGRLLVRAVERTTGAPMAACRIGVMTHPEKKDLGEIRTDSEGLAELKIDNIEAEQLMVMGRCNDQFAIATVGGWTFNEESQNRLQGYVYSDRPVYRPGHPVHVKAILRRQALEGYALPKGGPAEFEVQDPDGKAIVRKSVSLSQVGSASIDYTLPTDAALGYYSVEVKQGGNSTHGGFHVEEYRKPDYEVRATAKQQRIVQGGSVQMTINARYYYGEPVANANVTWAVFRTRHWMSWYAPEDEISFDGMEEGYAGEQVAEGEGKLDADGNITVNVGTERAEYDTRYRVEARVTDASNREISGAGFFLATRGDYYVHVRPANYVYEPGQQATIHVETRDYDGKMAPNVKFSAELIAHAWDRKNRRVVATLQGATGKDGRGAVDFAVQEGGSYMVVVTAGSASAPVTGETYLWVTGDGAWGPKQERIQIVPDKGSYKPGDTAKLLLVTGAGGGNVWLTIEGRGMHWSKMVTVRGASQTVAIPVEAAWAPNVFVEAVFLRDNTLMRGSRMLKVPATEKQLTVEVVSSKPEYQPGEKAQLTVTAKDAQGKPVAAEFSVGVVDEAIYAIKREMQGDIVQAFYGRQWNRVHTDSSMYYYFYGEAGTRRMELAKLRPAGTRAQLKPERLVQPKVRKEFPDTAFWLADLRTGANGQATVNVVFPDSLTTWRTTARGVTADTRVGQTVQKTIVRKNLLLTIASPRFLTEDDEVVIPVLVRNYLPSTKRVKVSMKADGLTLIADGARDVEIASKAEAKIDFRYKVPPGVTKATLTAQALGDEESDAMEITLPVEPLGLRWKRNTQGVLSSRDEVSVNRAFDPRSPAHSRFVEIQVTPSVAGAIFGALDYLINYPYGCVEQTMSSFLPNVVVSQAVKQLGVPLKVDEADLRKKTNAGLQRLYGFQHEDGGWGWWSDDQSDPFMTAYVASGLVQARNAGYSVESWRLDRAADKLHTLLADANRKDTADVAAYQLYALTEMGKARGDEVSKVYARRGEFTPMGWALFGLSAQERRDNNQAQEAAMRLETAARRVAGDVSWPVNRDMMLDFDQDATPEATAYALKFLTHMGSKDELLDGAAQWLVANRSEGSYWNSTKQTAVVIFGLTDYLKRSGELKPDLTMEVSLNGKSLERRRFGAGDALSPQPVKLRIPGAEAGERFEVKVSKQGAGRVYWSIVEDQRIRAENLVSPREWPMRLSREYYRMVPESRDNRVVYRLQPLDGPVKPGDLLAVRLTVSGAAQRFVIVEDPLPAGVEVVPRDDLYPVERRPDWWRGWYERRELRDSRVTYFPTWLTKDGAEYTYLIRVTNAGRFNIPPARIEPMYRPGYVSATGATVLEVQPQSEVSQ